MPTTRNAADSRPAEDLQGHGGELHQQAGGSHPVLTTNQGLPLADNQNSLRASPRGPTLLEDFILREKITHFDHERIPERIVHARGTAAHGTFELSQSLARFTRAKVLSEVGRKVPVFARFSTVAGGAGSVDTPRDVRGFAVKFYTDEGNWDLVGNNVPVFFIQDAMKFPDLVHSVKMEPDRGFPQAGSAHDTFWDFVSLMPESLHAVMWAMSDRAIPRTLRTMEGFGVHTFRLISADGTSTFVKFHWRPVQGMASTVWDEAVKLQAADNDFHRRDLFEAIGRGDHPAWDLAVQLFTQAQADGFPFDHLDPTKLIPEELVPLQVIGRMTLDRYPDNVFAETEQVAFCPEHVVPGIDFSNDPLLQGRLFSYTDTQLSRLGGPNFHQIPINAPKCPFANLQRDGHMQMAVPKGRVNYEPSSLQADSPRESAATGFVTAATADDGSKGRVRAESFADHYSQPRMFYRSQTPLEQAHMRLALVFELSKVETAPVRQRVLSLLRNIDEDLALRVADGLGEALPAAAPTAHPVLELEPSPKLSIVLNMKKTLQGRCVGLLVADGSSAATVAGLRKAVEKAGAVVKVVAPKLAGASLDDGRRLAADGALMGMPSSLFDAVAVVLSDDGARALAKEGAAGDFVRDAFGHLKAIGCDEGGLKLLAALAVVPDEGVVDAGDPSAFVDAACGRFWEREPGVRTLP